MKNKSKSRFQKVMENSAWIFGLAAAVLAVLHRVTSYELFSILAITVFTFFYHFAMRLAVGGIVPLLSRRRKYDPNSRWFRQKSFEKKLYKKLNVKGWKDKMPTYAPDTFSFEKHTPEEIVQSMCVSELVHEVIILFSFVPLMFAILWGTFPVFLITSLLAAAIDCSFVIMQRYNRPRLVRLIERQNNAAKTNSEDKIKE